MIIVSLIFTTLSSLISASLTKHPLVVSTLSKIISIRIIKCNPWGGSGIDLLPKKNVKKFQAESNMSFNSTPVLITAIAITAYSTYRGIKVLMDKSQPVIKVLPWIGLSFFGVAVLKSLGIGEALSS